MYLTVSSVHVSDSVHFSRAENDTDDVELNVVRYKVDGIETLARTTKFTKKELQLMYRGFKAVSETKINNIN